MNIKLNLKEVIILGVVAPILAGIVLFHYEDWFGDEPEVVTVKPPEPPKPRIADDIVAQIKSLQNPLAPVKIALWLNEPDMTQFTTRDDVTLYYVIKGLSKETPVYVSLFNVSPSGELSSWLFNQETKIGEILTYPAGKTDLQPGGNVLIVTKLSLEAGQEYFKVIVTSAPLIKDKFLAAASEELKDKKFWGIGEITVNVVSQE